MNIKIILLISIIVNCGNHQKNNNLKQQKMTNTTFKLPLRVGEAPEVGATTPQLQFSDKSPENIRQQLWDWSFSTFPNVRQETSKISVPTSQALWLHEDETVANTDAFMPPPGSREFTHLHIDGSIHAVVGTEVENEIMEKNWGVRHPLYFTYGVKEMLVYAPRNEEEIKVLKSIIIKSYEYATGKTIN
jgi:hypothetical protein